MHLVVNQRWSCNPYDLSFLADTSKCRLNFWYLCFSIL